MKIGVDSFGVENKFRNSVFEYISDLFILVLIIESRYFIMVIVFSNSNLAFHSGDRHETIFINI